jgi:hypothetical protein
MLMAGRGSCVGERLAGFGDEAPVVAVGVQRQSRMPKVVLLRTSTLGGCVLLSPWWLLPPVPTINSRTPLSRSTAPEGIWG